VFRVVFILVRLFNAFEIIDICVLCIWHDSIKEIIIIIIIIFIMIYIHSFFLFHTANMLVTLLCASFLAAAASAAPQVMPWLNMDAPAKSTNDILQFEPMTPFEDVWANYKLTHRKNFLHTKTKPFCLNWNLVISFVCLCVLCLFS